MQRFDIATFLAEEHKEKDLKRYTEKNFKKQSLSTIQDYKKVKEQIETYFEDSLEKEISEEMINLKHNAIIGEPKASKRLKDEIADYLRKFNLMQSTFPSHYPSLVEALFEDIFGLGPLSTWRNYPNSQSAQIIGQNIFYLIKDKLILQEEKFDSLERVEAIIRSLTMLNPKAQINERKPQLEVDMYDGTRVSMFIPPRSSKIIITFRRFVVKNFTLEDQARFGTIPHEMVPLLKSMRRAGTNIFIVGKVRSGKSTMLKSLFNESDMTTSKMVIEKHFELKLEEEHPDAPIVPIQATEEELKNIMASTLRHDADSYVLGEIRSVEAELGNQLMERGTRALLTTFHSNHTHNIPGQIARLVLDSFTSRNYESERIRAADNIDFVIVMKELKDKSKKLVKISEIRLNPSNLEVSSHDIVRFNDKNQEWEYRYDISDELVELMESEDPASCQQFLKTLRELASLKPITGETVIVSKY